MNIADRLLAGAAPATLQLGDRTFNIKPPGEEDLRLYLRKFGNHLWCDSLNACRFLVWRLVRTNHPQVVLEDMAPLITKRNIAEVIPRVKEAIRQAVAPFLAEEEE